jgi:hypothetical protein
MQSARICGWKIWKGDRLRCTLSCFSGKPRCKFWNRLKWKKRAAKSCHFGKDKMYEIKLKQVQCPMHTKSCPITPRKHILETRPVCEPIDRDIDISEGIPNKDARDPCKSKLPKPVRKCKREEDAEKIEIYYFDHGNSAWVPQFLRIVVILWEKSTLT